MFYRILDSLTDSNFAYTTRYTAVKAADIIYMYSQTDKVKANTVAIQKGR